MVHQHQQLQLQMVVQATQLVMLLHFQNTGAQLGGASSITITVVSASIGDVVYVKNGVYRETLPLRVPAGVTVQGESLRGTEIRPNTGTGHQVKTVT
jgi:pectin methylesterase-like acyl-CoA thioesterase